MMEKVSRTVYVEERDADRRYDRMKAGPRRRRGRCEDWNRRLYRGALDAKVARAPACPPSRLIDRQGLGDALIRPVTCLTTDA
jgi:hypothetical protein